MFSKNTPFSLTVITGLGKIMSVLVNSWPIIPILQYFKGGPNTTTIPPNKRRMTYLQYAYHLHLRFAVKNNPISTATKQIWLHPEKLSHI